MIAGTGMLHVIYFVLLQRSYRSADFSLVCPLARGTGPLVTALAAVALFGERLAALQGAGFAIIIIDAAAQLALSQDACSYERTDNNARFTLRGDEADRPCGERVAASLMLTGIVALARG